MIKKIFQITLILLLTCLSSCKKDSKRTEAEKIVAEWVGKEIVFPTDVPCMYMGKDTVCPEVSAPYKILVYTDSVGCVSCKSYLNEWSILLEEAKQIKLEQVSFLFYFQPKSKKELQFLLKRDNFKKTVFADYADKLNLLNKFSTQREFQCFLLNEKNQVVLIGNPAMNPKLWDIYKKVIMGEEYIKSNKIRKTTIEVKQREIELGKIRMNEMVIKEFVLKNTGESPLVISYISSSCGCTVPEWEKRPIMPGDSTEIKVKITPDTSGFFRKSINVVCNIEKESVRLIMKGMVE